MTTKWEVKLGDWGVFVGNHDGTKFGSQHVTDSFGEDKQKPVIRCESEKLSHSGSCREVG